ncbi:MAG: DNA alkylation repair protein [Paludibacteraceae bacterium]|nr:DNA alkylation repair protein [Paludibacteraceae bacterium]
MITKEIEECLLKSQDIEYRNFSSKLMPTVDMGRVIGVRVPVVRQLAKEFAKRIDVSDFLNALPHPYFEEDNLHGFILEKEKNFAELIERLDQFLPYVDNWATCDSISPNVFKKHLPELLPHIRRWMASDHTYTIRFGIEMLMKYYLEDSFETKHLDWVASVKSSEYYVNMMIAWYFATALAKQYEATLPILEENRLEVWTHNKTIQKARESFRITPKQKNELALLKR